MAKYRYRIEKIDKDFTLIDTKKKFSKKEILELLHKNPERFSPNVILRPLYQEVILQSFSVLVLLLLFLFILWLTYQWY